MSRGVGGKVFKTKALFLRVSLDNTYTRGIL